LLAVVKAMFIPRCQKEPSLVDCSKVEAPQQKITTSAGKVVKQLAEHEEVECLEASRSTWTGLI
jgi:hypothetical protein